jgi:acetyltransferase-like isoleucine patch superfamily enzyme
VTFLSQQQLLDIPFRYLGKNVKISDKASIYNPEDIEIDDNSRIDDFCVISGRIRIGKFVHIAVFCNLAGGTEGIEIQDFAGLAYGCHVFSQSDDYSGETMTNPTITDKYKSITKEKITIKRHVIVGTGSLIFPGVTLEEGCAIGAASIVRKSTEPWYIYLGNPAKKLKPRSTNLLELEKQFLQELEYAKE